MGNQPVTDADLELSNVLQRYIMRLETENWALKQALGYPVPADKETINNPFKCGICDAREKEKMGCDALNKYPKQCPVCDGLGTHKWNCTLNKP